MMWKSLTFHWAAINLSGCKQSLQLVLDLSSHPPQPQSPSPLPSPSSSSPDIIFNSSLPSSSGKGHQGCDPHSHTDQGHPNNEWWTFSLPDVRPLSPSSGIVIKDWPHRHHQHHHYKCHQIIDIIPSSYSHQWVSHMLTILPSSCLHCHEHHHNFHLYFISCLFQHWCSCLALPLPAVYKMCQPSSSSSSGSRSRIFCLCIFVGKPLILDAYSYIGFSYGWRARLRSR